MTLTGYVIMPFMVAATALSAYNLYGLLRTANLRQPSNVAVISSMGFVVCGCVWVCLMIWAAYL